MCANVKRDQAVTNTVNASFLLASVIELVVSDAEQPDNAVLKKLEKRRTVTLPVVWSSNVRQCIKRR